MRFFTIVFLALFCTPARAETPLYEEEPYDQITLDAANRNTVLKVRPLDPSDRRPAGRARSKAKLVIRLLDSPEKAYEVPWRNIVKVESFEQLVLDWANELVTEGKFDEAYDYFAFLERNKPLTPGLNAAMEEYLHEEAKQALRRRQYDGVLALLRELYRRNPKWSGLDYALGLATDKLVDRYVKEQDYAAARVLLRNLAAMFPEHPVVVRWSGRLRQRAAGLLTEARQAVESGRWAKATELNRRIAALWPELPGARELAQAVHQKYPCVVVGVGSFAAAAPGRLDDWAARRAGRLLYRTLTEFVGPGAAGGRYVCPVGEISSKALGRRLMIRLEPDVHWAVGDATLGGSDVSRLLLEMASPNDPAYRVGWSDLLEAVSVRDVYGVEVELRRANVRPEAMLQIVLTPRAATAISADPPPSNGPFVVQSRRRRETVFTANRQYFAAEAGQPKELIERRYASLTQAVSALKRGEIQAIDRVNPWRLASLRADARLTVRPYAMPLVHCLVPNFRRPLTADPTFRRALAYGINRRAILNQMLGGAEVPGCVVTGSPFPVGIGPDDPMSYASDEGIEPRPYEPRLAIALANVALKNYADARNDQAKAPKTMPTLILAYPPDDIAAGACASIQKQLQLVGIPVELRPLSGPMPARIPHDVDLLYAELATWEPLVDARRVLGENGLSGGCSPYMGLALRRLDEAADWGRVRECLHRIHRIAHDDVALVPLWQLVDHFACHESLRGVAAKPVSLYQNVEQWRPAFQYPAEK